MGNASSLFGGAVQRTGPLSNGKGRALERDSVYTLAGGSFSCELQSPIYKVRSKKSNRQSYTDKAHPTNPNLQSRTYKAEPKKPYTKSPRYKIRSKRVKASCFNGCKGWCFQNPCGNSGCCPLFSEASTHHASKVYHGSVFALA